MSTPPYLDLPAGAGRITLTGRAGRLAGLQASAVPPRGTVVLVPGFTGSKEDFIAILVPLAVAGGWRVISYDQRGQYESETAAAYELEDFAADLHEVIAQVGGHAHVVGHSFGGLVARHALLDGTGDFDSLTLLDSGPGPVPAKNYETLQFIVNHLDAVGLPTLYELGAARTPPPAGAIGDFLRARFTANDPRSIHAMAHQLLTVSDRTVELAAAAAHTQVCVMYGTEDDVWTPGEQDMVATACGTTAIRIEGGGHSPAADSPSRTAAALAALLSIADQVSSGPDRPLLGTS